MLLAVNEFAARGVIPYASSATRSETLATEPTVYADGSANIKRSGKNPH